MKSIQLLAAACCWLSMQPVAGQPFTVTATVDFAKPQQIWDGFGVNYVQLAHSHNYAEFPQEYGGFSLLSEADRERVLQLIFGEEGLKPGLLKMFLDPLHQQAAGGSYDHLTTTRYLIEFARKGLGITRARGGDLSVLTTLYGPPAYMTRQKTLRGRDLDPAHRFDLADYLISWGLFLKEDQQLPLRYISLHNEGEDWRRWPLHGNDPDFDEGHDYNLYWPPSQVTDFLTWMPERMEQAGLMGVALTPGETSRWFQFDYSGYARHLFEHPGVLANVGLVTSHQFYNGEAGNRWFSGSGNEGLALLRSVRPELGAWVTSASWGKMDFRFAWEIFMNIRLAKVNGYIPWAVIQRPAHWPGGDPNPGAAFRVSEKGELSILPGYYWYKQFSRVGQPGMSVAHTECLDSEIQVLGFGQHGTAHPDAFVVMNAGVSATYRADAVDWRIGGQDFHFSTKDPDLHRERAGKYAGIAYRATVTPTGYYAEWAIPWALLQTSPRSAKPLPLDWQVLDGEYAIEGRVGWRENGEIIPKNLLIIREVHVDGHQEAAWEHVPVLVANTPRRAFTDPALQARCRLAKDDDFLYIWMDIDDPDASQHRALSVEIKGSSFRRFEAFRTSESGERYQPLGVFELRDGKLEYDAPPRSATTFVGKD